MSIYSLESIENSLQLNPVLLRTLKPHATPVVSGVIDRTGTLLATGGAEGLIKVWDIRGGYVSHTFRAHTGIISALLFFECSQEEIGNGTSADKGRSRSAGSNSKASSSVKNGAKNDHDNQVSIHLASGGDDGTIRIWDLAKRKATATLESHVSVIRGLDYSSEQRALVSASRDKTVIVWDVGIWKPRKIIPALESLESVGFLWAGSYLCTGGEFGRLRVWDTNSGREATQEQERGSETDGIVQLLFHNSEQSILSVRVDQSLILHSTNLLTTLEPGLSIPCLPVIRRISGNHDEIIDLAYVSLTGEMLALATNSESIPLVAVANSKEKTPLDDSSPYFGADVALLRGHDGIVICLDVDWSGCWLVTGAKDNTARLWRIDQANRSYECFAVFTGHAESLGAVALPTASPNADSTSYANPLLTPPPFILTGSQDKTIKRWNVSTKSDAQTSGAKRSVFTRKAHDKDINAISINHDSKLFASASQDRLVKVWSTKEGEVQGVLRGHKRGVWSVRFAPKDAAPVSGSIGPISSSRGLVVTGSGDKTVKVWSLSDYSCLRTFEGHTNSVLKVLWIPPRPADSGDKEGRSLLASGGGDGLVKIWDASTGECVCTLDNHTDRVWALAASASTDRLVSGGGDGVVTFWANTTATTAAASAAASEARIEQEQQLLNYVQRGNYREAIVLALQLKHPARLLTLFSDVVKTYPPERGSISGLQAVDDVIKELSDEQLYALLLRLRDWNTNAKTAAIAQRILAVVVRSYPAERLVNLQQRSGGLNDVLQALMAYTDKHYKRVEELIEESYLVDFIVKGMEEGGFVSEGDR